MRGITVEQSDRQVGALMRTADQAGREGRWDDAVAGWRELLAHPCAHHWVDAPGILDELHLALRSAGRYDEAIAAKREAIEAGYRSQPAPETDIAECLLEAGRRDEADRLFATLRARDPDDVWLYNAATYSYADVDPAESLRCEPSPVGETCHRWTTDRVGIAGISPEPASAPARRTGARSDDTVRVGGAVIRWFPADEWPVARKRWPEVAEGRPADHGEYCREVEGRIKMFRPR